MSRRQPSKTDFLVAETLNAFSSQRVAIVLTAAAFMVASALYLQGLGDVAWFLTVTYVFLPALLLPVYVARTPAERGAGFALVLYTYPVTQRQYFLSRFASNVLVGVAYMLTTLVFALPLTLLAGPYWLTLLPTYLLLCLGVVSGTSALGLLMGAIMGHHRMTTAGFIGFLVGLVAAAGPRMVLMVETISSDAVRLLTLRLLHLLPTVPAAALLPVGAYPVIGNATLQWAMLPAVTLLYLVLGHHAYCGLQGPEGWSVKREHVAAFGVAAMLLLATPALLPLDHGHPEPVHLKETNSDLNIRGDLILSLDPKGPEGAQPTGKLSQGEAYDSIVAISLRRSATEDITLHNVTVRLESDLLALHGDTVNLGDITVPGTTGAVIGAATGQGELVIVPVPLPVNVDNVAGLVWSEEANILAYVTSDEGHFVLEESAHVAPGMDVPSRTAPFGLAAAFSALAWGMVLVARRRK